MLKKVSLVEQIYDQTREDIINLEYPLGSKLGISDLQEKYGVSSTPVREALNRLQIEGLVEYENNVGARVLQMTREDIMEVHQLALVLHSAAIELSMNNGHNEEMAADMLGYIKEYEKAATIKERTLCVHRIVGVFYQYCDNKRLDANMGFIKGQQLILRNLYGRIANPKTNNSGDYMEMYKGVLNGDKEKVISTLKASEKKAVQAILDSMI